MYISPSNGQGILSEALSHWLAKLFDDGEDRTKAGKEGWCGELATWRRNLANS